jgi:hypothetical protein
MQYYGAVETEDNANSRVEKKWNSKKSKFERNLNSLKLGSEQDRNFEHF